MVVRRLIIDSSAHFFLDIISNLFNFKIEKFGQFEQNLQDFNTSSQYFLFLFYASIERVFSAYLRNSRLLIRFFIFTPFDFQIISTLMVLACVCRMNCAVAPVAVAAPVIAPYASSYTAHTINHAIAAPVAAPLVAAAYKAAVPSVVPAAVPSVVPAAYSYPYLSAYSLPYPYAYTSVV